MTHGRSGEADAPEATIHCVPRNPQQTQRLTPGDAECHGWDYGGVIYGSGSHTPGLWAFSPADKPASEVVAALKAAQSGAYFSAHLDDTSNDLAVFMTQALIDETAFINPDKSSTGDAAAGQIRYEAVCIACHGPDGNAINFGNLDEPEFLGHLAPDNPWEFFHKVRFGQPGWPMPSGITNDWTDEDVANTLAYVQTFTTEAALSGGAPLYDKWWAVVGLEAPEENQPLWATQSTNTRSGADTWRCKECHGWDYKGADGVYATGSHATGFPGIMSAAEMSVDEIVSWLNGAANPEHDFSSGLNEFAHQAMAKFITTEMADSSTYINADGTVKGDPANGRELFEGTCVACHGIDGKLLNFNTADEPEYVGTLAADNP
jgi:thiosulfate dehydrogenase